MNDQQALLAFPALAVLVLLSSMHVSHVYTTREEAISFFIWAYLLTIKGLDLHHASHRLDVGTAKYKFRGRMIWQLKQMDYDQCYPPQM